MYFANEVRTRKTLYFLMRVQSHLRVTPHNNLSFYSYRYLRDSIFLLTWVDFHCVKNDKLLSKKTIIFWQAAVCVIVCGLHAYVTYAPGLCFHGQFADLWKHYVNHHVEFCRVWFSLQSCLVTGLFCPKETRTGKNVYIVIGSLNANTTIHDV